MMQVTFQKIADVRKVLIEADEGTTDAIFVCHGDTLDTLKHYVAQVLERSEVA